MTSSIYQSISDFLGGYRWPVVIVGLAALGVAVFANERKGTRGP